MLSNMKKQYCKGDSKGKTIEFTDGSKMIVCEKAQSVFYATIRKQGWDETKGRPKATEETVNWYLELMGVKKK